MQQNAKWNLKKMRILVNNVDRASQELVGEEAKHPMLYPLAIKISIFAGECMKVSI